MGTILEAPYAPEKAFNGGSSTKFSSNPNAGSEKLSEAVNAIPKREWPC